MSYLSPVTSATQYGVVEVGLNINVLSGIISLAQDVSPTANTTFNSVVSTGNITAHGNEVVETVTPTAGTGISLTAVTVSGPAAAFTVNNIGVTSLIAGSGITISSPTGAVTVSSSGSSIISTRVVTISYLATALDDYIGVNSTLPVTITLPIGVNGTMYIIKDEHGTGNGTIAITGIAQTIDGAVTYLLTVPYSSATLVFRGTEWHIV